MLGASLRKYRWASHKSNPSPVPQGYAEIRTLSHVGGDNRCGRDTRKGSLRHTMADGALASQPTVEGIVLKAAWY